MKKIIIGAIVIIVLAVGYYLVSPIFRQIEVDETAPLPESPVSIETPAGMEASEGVLESKKNDPYEGKTFEIIGTSGHPAEGKVRIIRTDAGTTVRYEDFETINGPSLNVYLAKDLEVKEYADLGPIKGTKGNINYEVPEGINIEDYRYVMYWCVPFKALFNYADLGEIGSSK